MNRTYDLQCMYNMYVYVVAGTRHNEASGFGPGTAEAHAGGQSGEVSAQQSGWLRKARVSGGGPHGQGVPRDEEGCYLPLHVLPRL